eukprot:scaffold40589_cov59-Phaeocystis_antarctica.AAC.2
MARPSPTPCRVCSIAYGVWCTPGSGRFVLNVTNLRRKWSVVPKDELRDAAPLSEATADLS